MYVCMSVSREPFILSTPHLEGKWLGTQGECSGVMWAHTWFNISKL